MFQIGTESIWAKHFFRNCGIHMSLISGTTRPHPIIPLVVKHDSKGDVYKKIRFYSGVYFYESDYYKIQNYFLIYNYSRDLIDSSREHGLFLSSLSYKKTDTRRKYSMLYDYLMNYRYETDEMDYKFRAAFSLLRIKHNDSIYRNSFFPLWYYSHYSNYKTLWFTPFLTYMDREFKDKYDLVLLGLLYYRDYIPDEEYDRRLWLSGILWDEIRKPEKGYHSMASVWGLLWEHETESVNDFKKLTILKGIYKYVNNKGRIKRRILWVIPI